MKKRRSSSLWLYFVLSIFAILIISILLITFFAVVLYQLGYLVPENGSPLIPLGILLLVSAITGTFVSLTISNRMTKHVKTLSELLGEVATGNFDVKLKDAPKIPEVQEMVDNFNRMVKELSGIETLRNDFIANVSHEIKTPIASIEGYAALLQDKSLTESEHEIYTQMIIDSSRQLASLTGNILKLSKLENQEMIPDKKRFRLDEQIRQVILLLEPEWSKKELELDIDLRKTTYNGSEELLHQVWMNLIGNAIKFTPAVGMIGVFLFTEDDDIIVQIKDTGCGIPNSMKTRIFDKFYQGDASRNSKGNGLGLALVKRILELCDGQIQLESQMGRGSTFTIKLKSGKKLL